MGEKNTENIQSPNARMIIAKPGVLIVSIKIVVMIVMIAVTIKIIMWDNDDFTNNTKDVMKRVSMWRSVNMPRW